MKIYSAIVFATFTTTVLGCMAASPDDDGAGATSDHAGQVTQALTGTHKVCSAVDPGNFRDSIEVDDGWSTTTCLGWARAIGAGQWQMGCMFSNGFSWGGINGGLPSPNCGW